MNSKNIHHYTIMFYKPDEHFDYYEEDYKTLEEVKKRYKELKKDKDITDIKVFENIEDD